MCGIVSLFAYNSAGVDRDELRRIRDHMAKRGPDGSGEWYSTDNRIGLGHRRLAIIDTSETGVQPMSNEDCTVWITFNGEIYNYQALRSELLACGHRFKSSSDTEVIIHGYEEWGIEDMLKRLRGMFAFAIYDSGANSKGAGVRSKEVGRLSASSAPRLIIARDPFGIKPLYYSDDGRTFRAASQVKALLAGGKIDTSPEPAGHVGFYLWGSVPEPHTLFKGVRALPAGSYMCIQDMSSSTLYSLPFTPRSYYSIPQTFADAERNPAALSEKEAKDLLRNALLDTVGHHLIADVPVGVFLSAGLDSTTLTALASENTSVPLSTVTLGFREYCGTPQDETPFAEEVAGLYKTNHSTLWIEKKDFEQALADIRFAMDQPTIDGVNTYFVSRAAKQAGLKVALSGLGGDELFGGYPGFSQIPGMVRFFSPLRKVPGLGAGLRVVSAPFLKHMTSPKYAGLLEYGGTYSGAYLLRRGLFMPWELPSLMDGEILKQGWQELQTLLRLEETLDGIRDQHLRVSALEMSWYMRNQLLRDTDWASMAHSLEVRVPLVDSSLLRTLSPLIASSGFFCNKQGMAATPQTPLPTAVMTRNKTGFTIPVSGWISEFSATSGERGYRGWARSAYAEFIH